MMPLTSSEIQHLANEAGKAGAREMLLVMGVDASDDKALLQMQRDFAHLRDWRIAVGEVKRKGIMTLVGILVTGVAGAVLLWFRGH